VSFNATDGVTNSNIQNELFQTLTTTSNGLFLGDFQLSESPSASASILSFTGMYGIQLTTYQIID
jgi:hypothetical protein